MIATACWLAGAAAVLAAPAITGRDLGELGGDLVLVPDPQGTRPVEITVALWASAPASFVRSQLALPATYPAAIPSFRPMQPLPQGKGELAWELEIPLWNLAGRARLVPKPDGVELIFLSGDLAPGSLHIVAEEVGPRRTLLHLRGQMNVRDANWVVRRITRRFALGEPAISAAASYVLLKALALYFEHRVYHRSQAPMAPATLASLQGASLGRVAARLSEGKTLVMAIHHRLDGRLHRVEASFPVGKNATEIAQQASQPQLFQILPGWKDTTVEKGKLAECRDPAARCWVVDSEMPFFDLDATWKLWGGLFRAQAVDENLKGAVMALDAVDRASGSMLVLSQSMGLHKSGYFARKLIAAEPLLEHGLALALLLVDTVSLAQGMTP